jgi:CDP-diacylglycerol--glycerol-3-phosphate 3-phosphatidyltransferase
MLNHTARATTTRLVTPVAVLLQRAGVTPDAVTLVGTAGVVLGAVLLYPTGHLLAGTLVITFFVLFDVLDGTMARISGRSGPWGAFLDSTLDRVADAAIFTGLVVWGIGDADQRTTAVLAVICLALGSVVPYARARAEALGLRADVGIAERAERLIAVLVATGLVGLGLPVAVLTVVLALLAVASLVTIVQRVAVVRRQIP